MRDSGVDLKPQLAVEFRRLRRGRGLQAAGLADRLGPLLTELVDASANASDLELRRKVRVLVEQLSRGFPAEQCGVILSALAAHREGASTRLSG